MNPFRIVKAFNILKGSSSGLAKVAIFVTIYFFFLSKDLNEIRLDVSGNKEGVCARFLCERRKFGISIRNEYSEIDYEEIYHEPAESTIKILLKKTR